MLNLAISFLTLLSLSLAAPLEKKQYGVQVINNCYQSGQIALTFDGELSPSVPLAFCDAVLILWLS